MKYCRTCKTRAKPDDVRCSRCGGDLATWGAPPPGGMGDAPRLALQGQILALEQVQAQHQQRGRALLVTCLLALAALLLVLYRIYAATVLSYAILSDVRVEQDPREENRVKVSFEVVQPGRVAFDRRSGSNHTEKLDVYTQPGPVQLNWAWPSDKQTGIDFNVIYRAGWTRTFQRQHFAVAGKTRAVDIVFLLDTTGSMTPFIKGLQQKCIEFADVVRQKGLDCRLGLVGFGDVRPPWHEEISILDPTTDSMEFQGAVGQIPRTQGGDIPESGVEALERALAISYRPGATVCFIHITDAPCHGAQRLSPLGETLRNRGIIVSVVSRESLQAEYSTLCVNGGKFYALDAARFEEILIHVAGAIASQIGYQ